MNRYFKLNGCDMETPDFITLLGTAPTSGQEMVSISLPLPRMVLLKAECMM